MRARRLPFAKMSGAGNDFVLVEESSLRGRPRAPLARRLCLRRGGVGADGLLIVGRKDSSPTVDYYNADGSRAFCANGARCAAWWARRRGWVGKRFTLRSSRGDIEAEVPRPGRARLRMPAARRARFGLSLRALGRRWKAHSIDTGVPHAVVEVEGLDRFPVASVGRALRRHPAFGRAGANVNFISRRGRLLLIRTYERGVEDETLACGTGAVAAALCAHRLYGLSSPIRVQAAGGELAVRFDSFERIWLEGPAEVLFEGEAPL